MTLCALLFTRRCDHARFVIVSGARTAVGAFAGALKSTPVVQLGAASVKGAGKKAGLKLLATENVMQFEPDAFKSVGMVELEKNFPALLRRAEEAK